MSRLILLFHKMRGMLRWLAGKVVSLGRELGVPTPTFNVMYAALKPYANGAPK
jgi:2-dehydropantoate 2-reductase